MHSRTPSGKAVLPLFAAVALLLLTAGPAMAAERPLAARAAQSVEVLRGTVKAVAHRASGRAGVVATGRRRVLNLRSFRIDPGPRVRVYLVPRRARGDGQIPRDFKDLGALKGSRGNQRYTIPSSVDLRKYTSVVFWCVPFTQSLARADLSRA